MVQHSKILSGGASSETIAEALGLDVIKALSDLLSRQSSPAPVRRALRQKDVLEALGIGKSQLYDGIVRGIYPGPCKVDENGRNSIWWDNEIRAIQDAAIARRDAAAKAA